MPRINVPAHDNSAMDGYAVRFSDLEASRLKEIGTALAGKPFHGKLGAGRMRAHHDRRGDAAGRRHRRDPGSREEAKASAHHHPARPEEGAERALRRRGPQGRRRRAEPGKIAASPPTSASSPRSASAKCACKRRLRVAFFATGDELASIGTPLKEGEVYDSNRYTVHGMLARLGVEVIDMGVVRDDPGAAREAHSARRRRAPTWSSPPAASRSARRTSSSR